MPKEKSAGAIIFREEGGINYYLLLHYAPAEPGKRGQWGFAKGHIEKGETDEQAAKREVAEETGITDLEIVHGFKEQEKYFFKKNYGLEGEARQKAPWVFKLVVFFLARTAVKDIKISDEHIGFAWLPFKEATSKITYKNSKELLKKADDFLKKNN